MIQDRRRFLGTLATAGAARLIGPSNSLAQEAPPETTTIRMAAKSGSTCVAPQYIARELLRQEGFTDIRYIMSDGGPKQAKAIADGEVDLTMHFSAPLLIPIDAGDKITIVGGVHVGCFELFATDRIRSIAELRGKRVGVQDLGASPHVFISTMAAHVGLDPAKDINWVTSPSIAPMELFVEGKIRRSPQHGHAQEDSGRVRAGERRDGDGRIPFNRAPRHFHADGLDHPHPFSDCRQHQVGPRAEA